MSNILNSKDFGLKIYNRFPPKYREDDALNNYALMRYLQALSDGGFKYSIDDINGIINLIDADKVDSKVLPIMFKQYGLEIFNGIPEQYLRYLLPKLGETWSRKGSLSAVEFITSSLSGIKTTTNIAYDEKENPTVIVRLEMDYSLGDYFPDTEQFKRLLTNFVPFYTDVDMVYSYLFYESQILNSKDSDFVDVITHRIEESASLLLNEGEDLEETIKQVMSDSGKLSSLGYEYLKVLDVILDEKGYTRGRITHTDSLISVVTEDDSVSMQEENCVEKVREKVVSDVVGIDSDIEDFNNISTLPIHDSSSIKGNENVADKLVSQYQDSGTFSLTQSTEEEAKEKNAILGQAIMGRAVLGGSVEYSDKIVDNIADTRVDGATFSEPVDSFLNKEECTLSGNFYTNGLYCFDLVTISGITTAIY